MTIAEANEKNRKFMRGCIHHSYEMSWDDDTLMDTLLGKFPTIRETNRDNNVRDEIRELTSIINCYCFPETNRDVFIKQISACLERIYEKEPYWRGISLHEISYFIEMQKFCVISGHGGMGKSYFIYQLEDQLQENTIPHLCLYGKNQKDLDEIDFEEIRLAATRNTFVFIFDAINEIELSQQRKLLAKLESLYDCSGLRIILTYRTHKIFAEIATSLERLASKQYVFGGVSYESALEIMLRLSTLSVYRFEHILFTNNALYLQMLCKVLSESKVTEEEINSISTLSFVFETYIKRSINKDHWEKTKLLSKWMYDNRKREIPLSSLESIVNDSESYVLSMQEFGFLAEYIDDEPYYYFAVDSLADFLLARFFLQEIKGKDVAQQIQIIIQRRADFRGMDEAFILAIFDLTHDFSKIGKLLTETGLLESFDLETLSHINFDESSILAFQNVFSFSDPTAMFQYIGGYTDKPYNCVNYLNTYFTLSPLRQKNELSQSLSGRYLPGRIKERLKNMVYFVSIVDSDTPEEMMWFSLWCTAAANQEVRCYAIKLLYEIVKKKPIFIDSIISQWDNIADEYIQEAVIQVFSLLPDIEETNIPAFLCSCAEDTSFLLARSLKRICSSEGSPYKYIALNKDNLYESNRDDKISKELIHLFWYLDILERNLIPFRMWSADKIDGLTKYLAAAKHDVEDWNKQLNNNFSCVKNGHCSGNSMFQNWVFETYPPSFSLDTLDSTSFMTSFEKTLIQVMESYNIDVFSQKRIDDREFPHSLFRKVVDISVDVFYGSLMCNYFTSDFSSFNNTQDSIGFEVYDPIEYDDEELFIASPIPTYNSDIERLGDLLISVVDQNVIYDEKWSKDKQTSIYNLISLFQPVIFQGKAWVLLNAQIRLTGKGKVETYDIHCCTDPTLHLTGNYDDRYLTIELPKYTGSIEQYKNCGDGTCVCKIIPPITNNGDWFDGTVLVFPPAKIVDDLNLHYCLSTMSWNTDDGQIIIYCDNSKKSYYNSTISSAVFIRKDIYDEYTKIAPIHFFCFTEKMLNGHGYTDEASLHLEILNRAVVSLFYNSDEQRMRSNVEAPQCQHCVYGLNEDEQESSIQEQYEETLKQLGYIEITDI